MFNEYKLGLASLVSTIIAIATGPGAESAPGSQVCQWLLLLYIVTVFQLTNVLALYPRFYCCSSYFVVIIDAAIGLALSALQAIRCANDDPLKGYFISGI